MDPLAGTPWSRTSTIEGFKRGDPNTVLLDYAAGERQRRGGNERVHALDIGCGAGRNAVPLAEAGWGIVGLDLSCPMLVAAQQRAREAGLDTRAHFMMAPMHALPIQSYTCDLIVAHGIWNLARSAAEFRAGVFEAARVAKSGAGLFVFTFSRHTLPAEAEPVAGEPFVYTQFSGDRQCFVTEEQLIEELAAAGFTRDADVPLREYNRPRSGQLPGTGGPVIYEAAFRRLPAADRTATAVASA